MKHGKTITGREMVILTPEEYAALTAHSDDAADNAMMAEALAEADGAPTLPADLAAAVLDGTMHPLTAWRSAAGLSMADLADKSGARQATISDIENSKVDPRYSTVRSIAAAMGLDPEDIMP